jgi:signal transduction histidine kinase
MRRYEKLTEHDEYKITFEYDENAVVNADSTMILQVVYNLINNAINYTGDDKIVRIVQNVNNGVVRISVADTGSGIEQDAIPYIWDRYYKVDKVHKRAVVGTGLGLSIVKGILESHRARYGVNSTVGVGSTFWFELDVMANEFTDAEFEE